MQRSWVLATVVEHIASAPQRLQQQRQWWSAQRHRSRGVRHVSMAIGRQPVPSSCLVALSRRPHFRRRRHPSSAALTRVRSVLCMCACGTCVSGADIRSHISCGLYSFSFRLVHGSSNLCSCAKCMSQESTCAGTAFQYAAVAQLGAWSIIALRRKCAVESL